jgi:PAS domain S-box-containing protein
MMRMRLGPVSRISLGLVSLVAFLVLTADMLFGLLPDYTEVARQVRKRTAESLAVQITALVQAEQYEILRRALHSVVSRDPDVLSIGVRRTDGDMVAETGNHQVYWVPPKDQKSTLTSVLVPISGPHGQWGRIEMAYKPMTPASASEWLRYPGVSLTLLLFTAGFGLFYLYLRRVLRSLDPSAAIPDRVRSAFDALSEGVLVVDRQGIVLLANRAFRQLHPRASMEMTGKRIKDIEWLASAAGEDPKKYPWVRAMERGENVTGEFLQIASASGEKVKVAINCSPIHDGREQVRGCLITFDDLSTVEHMNQALLTSCRSWIWRTTRFRSTTRN